MGLFGRARGSGFRQWRQAGSAPVLPWGVEKAGRPCRRPGHPLLIVDVASGVLWERPADRGKRGRRFPAAAAPASRRLTEAAPLAGLYRAHTRRPPVDRPRRTRQAAAPDVLSVGARRSGTSSTLRSVPISGWFVPPFLELLGLDKSKTGRSTRHTFMPRTARSRSWCLKRSRRLPQATWRRLAPVRTPSWPCRRIGSDWLDSGGDRFHVVDKLYLDLPLAVACYGSRSTQEALVVCSDGFIARLTRAPRTSTVRNQR